MDYVRIFDTTLRDGEQSPGATLNADEKLEIARQLARLGVDIIEAGFPVASPDDFAAVRRIAEQVEGPVICGLARAVEADVDRAWEAVRPSARPRIHVFMSTSDIHLQHQFRKSRQQALEATRAMVARARGYTDDVEFSPMDATRTAHDYLFAVLEAAVEEGATTLNIPDTTEIHRTSRLVSARTGILVQPNKAVVGSNAFAHESGIHQDGVLKERSTYEIMDAREVGLGQNRLVLGKHSGRHAIKARLQSLGYALTPEDLGRVFLRFKELADKKKEVSDLDLEALVADEVRTAVETFRLDGLQVTCGDPGIPTAAVRLLDGAGNLHVAAATGTGPVDAAYKAIDSIVGPSLPAPHRLAEYAVQAVTAGIDAIGEVHVRVEAGTRIFVGRAGTTDIVVASARAYLDALNRLIAAGPSVLAARPTPEALATTQTATV